MLVVDRIGYTIQPFQNITISNYNDTNSVGIYNESFLNNS